MPQKIFLTSLTLICIVSLTSCKSRQGSSTPTANNMANPASVYCVQQGYKSKIVTAADGSQSGLCVFPDGSSCDEWAYYRGECKPGSQGVPTAPATTLPAALPTTIPTAMPIDPAEYQGWSTYTQPIYGFTIRLSQDWEAQEVTTDDSPLNGHVLILHPQNGDEESIRMTFRRAGEDTLLWPTGVGQGDFVVQGTLDVAGQPVERTLLVCPTGEVTSIWYRQSESAANIRRGDMEFGFIFSAAPVHCQAGASLNGKTQRVGEMIIASLKVK